MPRISCYLVDIQLDEEGGNMLARLGIVLADAIHRLWHIFQHQIQVHLILLRGGVKTVLQLHHVGVAHHLHDLQLPILEALVLQHLLDRHLHI